jgi:molybdenum cofactor synthesis domain-containing protein
MIGRAGTTIVLMRIAVLTISDRCSQGLMQDTAGPAVVALLRAQWPEAQIDASLLPDEEDQIAAALRELAASNASLVLTVGGTGLSPRDRTPEATRRVIDREAPGLAEAMRSSGAQRNAFAWLSRGVAGLAGQTLIVNLPGSRRGAEESLAAILSVLKHAVEVADGGQTHP